MVDPDQENRAPSNRPTSRNVPSSGSPVAGDGWHPRGRAPQAQANAAANATKTPQERALGRMTSAAFSHGTRAAKEGRLGPSDPRDLVAILARDDEARRGVEDQAKLDVQGRPATHDRDRKAGAVNKRPMNETLQMPSGTHPGQVGQGHGPAGQSQGGHGQPSQVGSPSQPQMESMQSMSSASNTMDPVWQRLWLRCQQHDWQSMAFIGSSKRDPDGVLEIAHGMARLASELGQELTVFDARNLGLKDMGRMLAQIQSITSRG